MKTYLYRASNLHFSGLSFIAEVNFWRLPKTVVSCDKFINIVTRNVLLSAQMGERASVVLICIITSRYNEVK